MCLKSRLARFVRRPKSRPILALKAFCGQGPYDGQLYPTFVAGGPYRRNREYGPAKLSFIKAPCTTAQMRRNGNLGFHALKRHGVEREKFSGRPIEPVLLWGLIAEHTYGYRAEFFRILPKREQAEALRVLAWSAKSAKGKAV